VPAFQASRWSAIATLRPHHRQKPGSDRQRIAAAVRGRELFRRFSCAGPSDLDFTRPGQTQVVEVADRSGVRREAPEENSRGRKRP
jgi:hypothetical protein